MLWVISDHHFLVGQPKGRGSCIGDVHERHLDYLVGDLTLIATNIFGYRFCIIGSWLWCIHIRACLYRLFYCAQSVDIFPNILLIYSCILR